MLSSLKIAIPSSQTQESQSLITTSFLSTFLFNDDPMVSFILMEAFSDCPIESESESCSVVSDSLLPRGLYSPWNSPGQNTGVGSRPLLQGTFATQGSNPGLLHYRQILYCLNYQRSPIYTYTLVPRNIQVTICFGCILILCNMSPIILLDSIPFLTEV